MEKTKKMNPAQFLMPGCMFIGMGVGFLINYMVVGLFFGLGVGFLATAIYKMYEPKTEK